jgi:hypothetical protein
MNIFTTLRQQVLRDLGINPTDTKSIRSIGQGIFEAGGSFGDYTDEDPAASGGGTDSEDLSLGIDYFADPIEEFQFDNSRSRFATMDSFLQFIVSQVVFGLRVLPTYVDDTATYTVKILKTGNHPVLINGKVFTYAGATIDLTSYFDDSVDVQVLLVINPNYVDILTDPAGAIEVITDIPTINDKTLWPLDKVPTALITIPLESTGITNEDIEDVRCFISWGNSIVFEEKTWFTDTISGVSDYEFDEGIFPASPFNKNCSLLRNGQTMNYGADLDFTISFNSLTNRYVLHINFPIATGERLKANFVRG